MKGIVLCEFSGVVSAAFRAQGLECWSCDLLPTEGDPAWHIQQDAIEVAYDGRWDFAVMHPECTKLSNSGAKHLYIEGQKAKGPYFSRWEEMEDGAEFYRKLREAPIEFKGVENPVMHGPGIAATKRGPTKFYHPHFFGDPFFKLTGFEMINLPHLSGPTILTCQNPVRRNTRNGRKRIAWPLAQIAGKSVRVSSRALPRRSRHSGALSCREGTTFDRLL